MAQIIDLLEARRSDLEARLIRTTLYAAVACNIGREEEMESYEQEASRLFDRLGEIDFLFLQRELAS